MAQVGTNGATRMIMTANGGRGRCMVKAPSGGRLVSGMMESGLREKSRAWVCSHGVMALPMTVSGSLAKSMASGYATKRLPAAGDACAVAATNVVILMYM